MNTKVLPLLPRSWRREMRYFTEDEFENKVKIKGEVLKGIDFRELNSKYNSDEYSPVDGKLIKACDKLAAFIEADLSIKHGTTSKHLEEGRKNIYEDFKSKKVSGTDFGVIFDYFKRKSFKIDF
jgi:putative hydrolase of HD superfamily